MFVKLSRTEGKGKLLLNGSLVVAVFETGGHTVIRTSAGGEDTSFIVTESAQLVAEKFGSVGVNLVALTHKNDSSPVQLNGPQIVALYERSDASVVRTTSDGEYANFPVAETIGVASGLFGLLAIKPQTKR